MDKSKRLVRVLITKSSFLFGMRNQANGLNQCTLFGWRCCDLPCRGSEEGFDK